MMAVVGDLQAPAQTSGAVLHCRDTLAIVCGVGCQALTFVRYCYLQIAGELIMFTADPGLADAAVLANIPQGLLEAL